MKTLIEKNTGISKLIFDDNTPVEIDDKWLHYDDTYIQMFNLSNSAIIYNVEPPEDWQSSKYMILGGLWINNPNWVELQIDNNLPSLDAKKTEMLDQLYSLRTELSALINECKLINEPEPPELTELINTTRYLYGFAKDEIASLTEENYTDYILIGPQVKGLISQLKTFL